jgi:hypothetical protein
MTATRPPLISTQEPTSSRRPCPHLEQPRPPQLQVPHDGAHDGGAHELVHESHEHAGSH